MLFAKISYAAIESIGSPAALAVYVGLMRFARFRDGGSTYTNGVWVSDEKLAAMLGIHPETVSLALEFLQMNGWIDWVIENDRKQYVVNFRNTD